MTNHEKIKQMTAEELAVFIAENHYGCSIPTDCLRGKCSECIKMWLEREVEE